MANRTIVITGGSQGLGLAFVQAFAGQEWQVLATGRSPQPDTFPADAHYHQFDAADAAACEAFWQQVKQDRSDAEVCLINNAGGYVAGGPLEAKPEDFVAQMTANYFTAVYMTRGLVKTLPKARIINVISSSALAAESENPAYGAAKAAEKYFFQALQQEFSPDKYQITNLYPSYIATHDPNPDAIDPKDLAAFVRATAESNASYYLRDVTLYPVKRA